LLSGGFCARCPPASLRISFLVIRLMIETRAAIPQLQAFLLGLVLIGGTFHPARPQDEKPHDASGQIASAPPAEPLHGVTGKLTSAEFLAAADRVYLRFMGYPELTGEYRVGPDQSISIPVLGRIPITEIDPTQLEKNLAAKLSQITKKEGYVTVEISAYKPIFITGAVKHPGAIEWHPDMTVIQAIALTGGVGAESGAAGSVDAAGGRSQALEKDIDNLKRVLATIARLTAERGESAQVATPQRLVTLVGDVEADRLIAHEADILKSNRDALAAKLKILQESISDGKSEINALRDQSAKINEQLQLRRDYLKKLGSMRPDEEEIKLSDLAEKLANIEGNTAKSTASVAELELAALALKKDREAAIGTDLDRLDREAAQLEISINGFQNADGSLESKAKSTQYQIVRQKKDGSDTFAANEVTPLKPGDVLSVALP
jgi:exopolysaccharide production protein ExoF